MKKLEIFAALEEGFVLGGENALRIIAAFVLYILTIWIPYLNVGSTIAMASLPAEIAKGKLVNPLDIFDSKYRRNMGEFFILMALMLGAIGVGLSFGFIPGIVIAYAWYISIILFVDKDLSALEALHESNRRTYGNKWRIFCTELLLLVAYGVVCGLISCLLLWDQPGLKVLAVALIAIISILVVPIAYGVDASIYKRLTDDSQPDAAPVDKA